MSRVQEPLWKHIYIQLKKYRIIPHEHRTWNSVTTQSDGSALYRLKVLHNNINHDLVCTTL